MKSTVTLTSITLLLVSILVCNSLVAQNIHPSNYLVREDDYFFGAEDWHHIDIALDKSNNPWVITETMEPSCQCNYISNYDGVEWHGTGVPASAEMHSVFADQNDLKWVGTSDGIYTYDGTDWVHYNSSNSGLTKNNVYCVKTDNAGKVWILSAENYQVYVTLWSGNSWQVFDPSQTQINYFAPGEFKLDNQNNFYFNDFYHLVKYDGSTWSVINSSFETTGFDVDHDNNVWYANDPSSDYFEMGEYVNSNWETSQLNNSATHEPPVMSLVADELGRKWIVELNDIWIYNGTDGVYLERPGTCSYSFKVCVGSDGNAWGVGTDGFGHCDVYQFLTSPVSTQDLTDAKSIEVFPNPATDVLQLKINSVKATHIEVKDVFGELVYSTEFSNSLSVDISKWSAGMYFIYTTENDRTTNQVSRFVKQ